MCQTIDELMNAVNCEKWPERWRDIYDEAMEEFDRNGCPLTDPSYYDERVERYGLETEYLDVYRRAAVEVGKSEALSRFLALLVRALKDRKLISADLKTFKAPKSPTGGYAIEYDMLTGLALCSLTGYSYRKLKKRGMPEEKIREIISTPWSGVREFQKRNGGAEGYHLLEWFQRSIEGNLFRIKRLEIEVKAYFKARAAVYRNKNGEIVVLADDLAVHRSGIALGSGGCESEEGAFHAVVAETEDSIVGHPFLESSLVSQETVSLKKEEWECVLRYGDPIVSLHIPPTGSLLPEAVDETIEETKKFLALYYPEYAYKAFYCASWLLDPQLEGMLGAESNIVKFGKRFTRLTRKSGGNAVFGFVFLKPNMDFKLSELPENTRLERALKAHYMNGKYIYEPMGFFF